MEFTCRSCGKTFQNTGNKKWAKYCPSCQKQVQRLRCQKRNREQRDARRRRAALRPDSLHKLDLDTVLRELARFNAQRRAEGLCSISYGRYVAMRDGYIQISGSAPVIGQTSRKALESTDQNLPVIRQQKRRECDGTGHAA